MPCHHHLMHIITTTPPTLCIPSPHRIAHLSTMHNVTSRKHAFPHPASHVQFKCLQSIQCCLHVTFYQTMLQKHGNDYAHMWKRATMVQLLPTTMAMLSHIISTTWGVFGSEFEWLQLLLAIVLVTLTPSLQKNIHNSQSMDGTERFAKRSYNFSHVHFKTRDFCISFVYATAVDEPPNSLQWMRKWSPTSLFHVTTLTLLLIKPPANSYMHHI